MRKTKEHRNREDKEQKLISREFSLTRTHKKLNRKNEQSQNLIILNGNKIDL